MSGRIADPIPDRITGGMSGRITDPIPGRIIGGMSGRITDPIPDRITGGMSGARRSIAAQMSLPRAGDATCALSGPFGGSGVSSACERAGVAVALAAAALFFGRPLRDRRSRTDWVRPGDPLNPIQVQVEANPGKNTYKPLVGRTICRSCLQTKPESAALNRPSNRPNRHKNRPKAGNRGQAKPRPVS